MQPGQAQPAQPRDRRRRPPRGWIRRRASARQRRARIDPATHDPTRRATLPPKPRLRRWVVINDDPDEFEIRPAEDRLPGLLFVLVPEEKTTKNRLHLDFRPDDRDAEVERLLALGATRADVGQGEQSWVVLADPEGNEFCVLGSRVS